MTTSTTQGGSYPQEFFDALDVIRRYIDPAVLSDGAIDGSKHQVPDPGVPEKKMWILVRTDIKMLVEKAMPQAGHGFLVSWVRGLFQNPVVALGYLNEAQPKISVRIKNESDLLKAYSLCQEANLPSVLIMDAARTFFPEPTYTVVCVGPCLRSDLPKFVKNLQLLVTEKPKAAEGDEKGGD